MVTAAYISQSHFYFVFCTYFSWMLKICDCVHKFIFKKSWGLTIWVFSEDSLLSKSATALFCYANAFAWLRSVNKVSFHLHLLALILFTVFIFIPPLFFFLPASSQIPVISLQCPSDRSDFLPSSLPSFLPSLSSPFPFLEVRKSREGGLLKLYQKKILIKRFYPTNKIISDT